MKTNITNLTVINPNYLMAVMWEDDDHITHRYALWNDVGEVFNFDVPLYAGQLIKKNFRLEVWTLDGIVVSQADAFKLFTSVLQGYDYRFTNDNTLPGTVQEVTNFYDNAQSSVIEPPSTNLVLYMRAGILAGPPLDPTPQPVQTWSSSINLFDNVQWDGLNAPLEYLSAEFNNNFVMDMSTGGLNGVQLGGFQTFFNLTYSDDCMMFVVMKSLDNTSTAPVISVQDATHTPIATISLGGAKNTFNLNGFGNVHITQTDQNIANLRMTNNFGVLASIPNRFDENFVLGNVPVGDVFFLSIPQSPALIGEILVYNGLASTDDFNQVMIYLSQKYGGGNIYAIPLVFPTDSIPTLNPS